MTGSMVAKHIPPHAGHSYSTEQLLQRQAAGPTVCKGAILEVFSSSRAAAVKHMYTYTCTHWGLINHSVQLFSTLHLLLASSGALFFVSRHLKMLFYFITATYMYTHLNYTSSILYMFPIVLYNYNYYCYYPLSDH